ncbi:Spy/CpxP family protein refolding chaperone [Paraburkholderia caffeinilytica]|uniref:Spy/CpxP family protein refolding chaperone n=1 Tax=Paraburkholderia caffeinilytica TaxID=1761016 RepID=UPI0038B740E4
MKRTTTPFQRRPTPMLAAGLLLAIATLGTPTSAATPGQTQASARVMTVATHTPVDTRIDNLHTRLQITADQESLWQPVAQAMRDNASAMDSLRQSRTANASNMSAVDDLRSYGQVVDAHADGVRKLTSVFETLYNSMSDTQKHNADLIFRSDTHHAAKKG